MLLKMFDGFYQDQTCNACPPGSMLHLAPGFPLNIRRREKRDTPCVEFGFIFRILRDDRDSHPPQLLSDGIRVSPTIR